MTGSTQPPGISDEAIEAAAKAMYEHEHYDNEQYWDELPDGDTPGDWRHSALRALAAALPHLRSAIADEIEAAMVNFAPGAVAEAARVARGGPTE